MHGQRTNESTVFLSVTKRKNPLVPAKYDSVNGVVGPVGTRVPIDLSFAGPVRWVDEIPLSPRRGMPGETAREESSRGTKYRRMPEETGLAAASSTKMPSSPRKSTQFPREALLAS